MKLDLFLLVGQSNMAGRGELERDSETPDPRIIALNAAKEWVPAIDPLHYDKPDIVGVGPGLTFANTLVRHGRSAAIGLIPCAVGGTNLERWIKGGDLYAEALDRAKFAQQSGVLKGILWHQGENDSMQKSDAVLYRVRFEGMIRDLRSDLRNPELPFLAGKIGDFLSPETFPYAPQIRAVVEESAQRIPAYCWIESAGLCHTGDSVHFDAASAQELGRRYAEAYAAMIDRLQAES